jgi:hypothetical protein
MKAVLRKPRVAYLLQQEILLNSGDYLLKKGNGMERDYDAHMKNW